MAATDWVHLHFCTKVFSAATLAFLGQTSWVAAAALPVIASARSLLQGGQCGNAADAYTFVARLVKYEITSIAYS
jgi:hypothetical protein